LGTRVTKYYHTAKIRDEKRGTEHTIFYVETPQQIRGKNHGARVENFHYVEEITGPLSKYKESTITTLSYK
jgi:hypothetical protein